MTASGAPRFERYARVSFRGAPGVVYWRDAMQRHDRPEEQERWYYVVYFESENVYRTIRGALLAPAGGAADERLFLGARPEVSYDVVMAADMSIVEGCYRLPRRLWATFFASKDDEQQHWSHRAYAWGNGVDGLTLLAPAGQPLGKKLLEAHLSQIFDVRDWVDVRAPDSMLLRP